MVRVEEGAVRVEEGVVNKWKRVWLITGKA